MFTELVGMWLPEGNTLDDYGTGVTNLQGEDNTGGYNKNIDRRVRTKTCNVETNNVYMISRINGYQTVLIDGYDRPKTKMPRE